MPFEALIFLATGLLIAALGVPLWRRRIRPNTLYGVRVPATFKDEWVWYEANARGGRDLMIAGAAVALASIVLAGWPGPVTDMQILALACLAVAAALTVAVRCVRHASALWTERQRQLGGRASRT